MATALLASNQSAVFIRTQTALGAFANPTTLNEDGTGGNVGTYAIRAVGAPKWAVRGAGIIDRKEVFTPWAGNTSSRTGGLGWDITLQTEFFWTFGNAYSLSLANSGQLAALWLASPWAISEDVMFNTTLLEVQPFFEPDVDRIAPNYAVQPFSMVYEETGGKRYEAFDCVALPKISWEYGQRIMIDWTIKGSWMPVMDSLNVQPVYPEQYTPTPNPQPPIIGVNCGLTIAGLTVAIDAVTKVTIDTGWTLNDVGDTRKEYGFGISFFRLDASPSLEIELAEFNETQQLSWGDAQNNIIGTNIVLVLYVGAGNNWTITLNNPQYVAFPENGGETNGYRSNALKWQAIPQSSTTLMQFSFTNLAP
jgi:hypothetical protein